MNKSIQIFDSPQFGQVRTMVGDDGEPWFVGKDVASILGYKDSSKAICDHVDNEDKTSLLIQQSGSNYKANTCFINESDFYALILSSKLPLILYFLLLEYCFKKKLYFCIEIIRRVRSCS